MPRQLLALLVGLLCALALVLALDAAAAQAPPDYYVTPYDTVPNWGKNPTLTAVQDGLWSSPATWDMGRLPTETDRVSLTAHTVLFDVGTARVLTLHVTGAGRLLFLPDASSQLLVGTLQIVDGGAVEGVLAGAPQHMAELVIRDIPIDTTLDPSQYGTGLLCASTVRPRPRLCAWLPKLQQAPRHWRWQAPCRGGLQETHSCCQTPGR
jgi:hypothetical protein